MGKWKAPVKPMTADEAVTALRKELAPYWLGSEPLLAGIHQGGKPVAYPLDPAIRKGTYLMVFVDGTDYSAVEVIDHFKEWHRRYHLLGLKFLFVFSSSVPVLRVSGLSVSLMGRSNTELIACVDRDGVLAPAFNVSRVPAILLMQEGKPVLLFEGFEKMREAELALHAHLRQNDPGLPLIPVTTLDPQARSSSTLVFNSQVARNPSLQFHGNWVHDESGSSAEDAAASITLESPSSGMTIVAQSLSKTGDPSRVTIELDGLEPPEQVTEEGVLRNEDIGTFVRVEAVRRYPLLKDLPPGAHKIKLTFPTSDRAPIKVHGIIFKA
jgi:hypothetical protein